MNKIYPFLCFSILFCHFLTAQNFSSPELIDRWKADDITQTIEAEETYDDLRLNISKDKFNLVISELNGYLKKHPDKRLEVRMKMYEILYGLEVRKYMTPEEKIKLEKVIKTALLIQDQQLLSELYTLYAEHVPGTIEDKLFYNTHAIEIQEQIGAEYFPKLYQRFYIASLVYFGFEEYDKSIAMGVKCMELLKSSKENLAIYCLQSDILGVGYFEVNKIDSGFYYYQNIKNALKDYNKNDAAYKDVYKRFGDTYPVIWNGISDGGIAKGLLLQKKYDEATPLINANLRSSLKFELFDDVAKAQNLLAEVYYNKGNINSAIDLWRESYRNAIVSNSMRIQLESVQKLIQMFKLTKKFDSVSAYYEKYILLKENHLNAVSQSKITAVNNRLKHEKLQSAIQEAELTIKKQNTTRNLIIAGAFLLIIIGLFSYNRYRLKQNIKYAYSEHNRLLAELEANQMKNQVLEAKDQLLQFRNKLKQNNQIIENLKKENEGIRPESSKLREATILTGEDWEQFKNQFDKVYPDYIYRLRENYPELTPSEIRYLCLVKLNLRQDEIASALGVSVSSIRVTWHRMRKKLKLKPSTSPINFLKKFDKQTLYY